MNRWPLNNAYVWETAPFLRVLLPFAAGILFYDRVNLPASAGTWPLVAAVALFIVYAWATYTRKSSEAVPFMALTMLMFCCGISVSSFSDIRNHAEWFGNNTDKATVYLARIAETPTEKEHTWKLPVTLIHAVNEAKVSPVGGKAFVYLYKDRQPMLLHKGDSVWLPSRWQPIHNAGNPFEFDYAAYCNRNNIHYQQTCAVNDIRLYATHAADDERVTERVHNWCMTQLEQYITDAKTKGLMQAMLLGDEVNLDEDLRQAFSETGIIHIIAISGGNVAIFFIVISFLLRWIKHKKYLWISYAIALPMVWFYVLMAGASPSAIRAALMFTLLTIAIVLQKNNNALNTLLATAFLLLFAQPMWLFSLGFQLSFVAVLSLILFYSPVYEWLRPKYKVVKWVWSATAASIAAEVLVAPLVIYYFHTFPLLFLVANVVAYFFMGAVLILGIVIIVSSSIPLVAAFAGECAMKSFEWFDKIITPLQGFNPQSFHFLMLSGPELMVLYVAIGGIMYFLLRHNKSGLFTGLVALCVLAASLCGDEWIRLHQQRLVVYNVGKANHIEMIKGRNYTVLQADTVADKKTAYAVKPAHTNWRAWEERPMRHEELFEINGKTVLLLHEDIKTEQHFPVDYVVINFRGHPDLVKLNRIFSPEKIVIGNGYTRREQDELVKGLGNVHATTREGAFVVK